RNVRVLSGTPVGRIMTPYARRLARRLASHDAGRSPLGAPPRRFWAPGPRFSHRHPPSLTLRRVSSKPAIAFATAGIGGQVPAGLIDQEDGVGSGRDGCGDLGEVQVHRLGVAGRHDQGCTLALLRADCTEDVGGSGPLVPRCAWTGAALGPAAGDLVLLAD